jgi:hypothetical protein
MRYTKKIIQAIQKAKLNKEDRRAMFLHCKTCIPSQLPFGMSPKEYGEYEIASVPLEIPGKTIGVVSVWCKHCGKLVWDSRHLTHAY